MEEKIYHENTRRIATLEKCVSRMGGRIEVIDERTGVILDIVQEVKTTMKENTSAFQLLAVANAENAVRWSAYEKDKARLEKRIDEIDEMALNNKFTLAKSLLLGGSGGVVGVIVGALLSKYVGTLF